MGGADTAIAAVMAIEADTATDAAAMVTARADMRAGVLPMVVELPVVTPVA
jgi:hypothetical protein